MTERPRFEKIPYPIRHIPCPECDGTGTVDCDSCFGRDDDCPRCYDGEATCETCHGFGVVSDEDEDPDR